MAHSTPARRTVVIKARRDTLVLVACAIAMTFALSYAVHTHPRPVAVAPEASPQREWVGRLADVASDRQATPSAETLTSASLVVSPTALALPTVPRPAATTKARVCDSPPCSVKVAAAPTPPIRQKAATIVEPVVVKSEHNAAAGGGSGIGRFNPLNHLPDSVRRPFDYAGSTISGWMHHL